MSAKTENGTYEVYIRTKYKVTFKANGGNGDEYSQDFVYGKTKTLTGNKFNANTITVKYEGNGTGSVVSRSQDQLSATFNRWKRDNATSGSTVSTSYSESKLTDTPGGAVSLYAQWKAASEITTLPTATRTGYKFLGWYTAASNGTKISAPYNPSANITLYAQWEAQSSNLTVKCNGLAEGQSAIYTVTNGTSTWTVILNQGNGYSATLAGLPAGTYTVTEKKWVSTDGESKQATIAGGESKTLEFEYEQNDSKLMGESFKTNWKKY